jgi:hypothetical protein
VRGEITDAYGGTAWIESQTCPSRLAPGESATWGVSLRYSGYNPTPPLATRFVPLSTDGDDGSSATDLQPALTGVDATTKSIVVSLRNPTSQRLGDIKLCAAMRSATGELLEVARARVTPSQLEPRESVIAAVPFEAIAPAATFDIVAESTRDCCDLRILAADELHITVKLFVNSGLSDRALWVVGELRNTTGSDLLDARMTVEVAGDPFYRVDAHTFGCSGVIPRNAKAPVWFTLPLRPGTDESRAEFRIVGAEAEPSTGESLRKLPVRNFEVRGYDLSGEVVNNTSRWMLVRSACYLAYDGDRLIGATSIPYNAYLAPGERLRVTGNVGGIDEVTSNEIVAYGEPVSGPPLPPPPVP